MVILTGAISMELDMDKDNKPMQCLLCETMQRTDHICPPPNKAFGDELIEPCGEFKWLFSLGFEDRLFGTKALVLKTDYFLIILYRHIQWTNTHRVLHMPHET